MKTRNISISDNTLLQYWLAAKNRELTRRQLNRVITYLSERMPRQKWVAFQKRVDELKADGCSFENAVQVAWTEQAATRPWIEDAE